jgi:hypothetical protein
MSQPKASRQLVVTLVIGAAVASTPTSAKAFSVYQGTDYLATPSGSVYTASLPGGGSITIPVKGLSIGSPTATSPDGGSLGLADTVVNRLDTVSSFPGTTNIEVVGLSLTSESPVVIPGFGLADIFIGLDPVNTSNGSITYVDDRNFNAQFSLYEKTVVAPAGALIPTGTNFIKNLIANCSTSSSYSCIATGVPTQLLGSGEWQSTPGPGYLVGTNLVDPALPANFFLAGKFTFRTSIGDPNPKTHGVIPTPAPLPLLGVAAILSRVKRIRKLSACIHQANSRIRQQPSG